MVTTRIKSLSELTGVIPDASLTSLKKLHQSRLKPFESPLAELTRAAVDDPTNFGNRKLDEFLASVIAELKAKRDAQKSAIIAHPKFRELERNHSVVRRRVFQKAGQGMRVRVVNASLADLRTDFADAGRPDLGWFYQQVIAAHYHRPGGEPIRTLTVADPVGAADAGVMTDLLGLAAEAHFVVLTTATPEVTAMEGEEPADFAHLTTATPDQIADDYKKADNAPLHGLQQTPLATRWLYAVGQANARLAHHPKHHPHPRSPGFVESNGPLRIPVSAVVGEAIAASYTRFGNGSRISGVFAGGKHVLAAVVSGGEVQTLDCVLNELHEKALHDNGLYCLLPWKKKDYAVGFDSPTAFVPEPTGDAQADADAVIASKLAFVLLAVEYGHRLKKELRYARGQAITCDGMKRLIEQKLKLDITPDANSASQATLARKPLAKVKVTVTSPSPGVFVATAEIIPHTLLVGARVSLKLKAELSAAKP
ncbi:MAG: type VI secretion system contractile sheath large subunit [Gemmataceae bacterium]